MDKLKIMNAFQLKLLMAFLMVLNHICYIDHLVPDRLADVFTIISRCVAPMFAYFAVEGIRKTHDLKRYCLRLSVLAGIVFIGNGILKMVLGIFLQSGWRRPLENNVIFTLALGVAAIALTQQAKAKQGMAGKGFYVLSAFCFLTGFFMGEWGTVLLPFMFIEYFFHEKKIIWFAGCLLIEAVTILLPFSEPYWFLVFPFILLYNGERGPKTKFCQYFFYVFYPVHLWAIAIATFLILLYNG
ncbi:MAG: conjugal transfer protein TraX [Lachnospiraceae bacterium]|nr:conjugal transfer protein TraX [Lachnospiraceae bacterium]